MPTLDWNVFFLRFETEINRIASFPKKNVMIIYMYYGLFKKNPKNEDSEFPGSFWKKYVSTTPVWILFWNSPIMLKYGQLELKKNPPILGNWSRWDINLKWPLILKETMKKGANSPYTPYYYMLQKCTKKTLWPLFMDGFNCLKGRATSRRQFNFLAISNMETLATYLYLSVSVIIRNNHLFGSCLLQY